MGYSNLPLPFWLSLTQRRELFSLMVKGLIVGLGNCDSQTSQKLSESFCIALKYSNVEEMNT